MQALVSGIFIRAARERSEAANIQAAGGDAFLLAEIVDRRLGRFHVRSHADDDVVGVVAAVRFDEVILATGLTVES